jgi:hypothetical protein
MPKIELQIYCAVCGEGLCEQTKVERSIKLFVQPCKNCLQEKWEEGYRDRVLDEAERE